MPYRKADKPDCALMMSLAEAWRILSFDKFHELVLSGEIREEEMVPAEYVWHLKREELRAASTVPNPKKETNHDSDHPRTHGTNPRRQDT